MLNSISGAIENLTAEDPPLRVAAAADIYHYGRDLAERATAAWWRDEELTRLLVSDKRNVTVGVAVRRETFARIRDANGVPELARVPPEQDAEEFELHFKDGVALDVLTSREPGGEGAIARFLQRFGEGVQQVEFQCRDVERATEILRERFGARAVYPAPRPGAGGTRINFFLLKVPGDAGASGKILIELYQKQETP
ncbi:MAG: hypothetical protein M3P45_02230 [Acidobacteriota bacterium]|nr:hypothetical protein [Acidobacteriota bacterium]